MVPNSLPTHLVVDLTQHLNSFFQRLDERRYDELLALFAPAGRWLRQGRWLTGRTEISAALAARSATMQVRHVITNVVVEPPQGDRVDVQAYMTAYRQDGSEPAALFRLNVVSCVYQRDGDSWLLAEQQLRSEFEFS